jgi:hypothetical protein
MVAWLKFDIGSITDDEESACEMPHIFLLPSLEVQTFLNNTFVGVDNTYFL